MKNFNKNKITNERRQELTDFLKKLKVEKSSSSNPLEKESAKLHLIDEALTHTSANQTKNHERLEFLGDAVLRLVASEFIERHFPKMKVGERSALRAQIVSDRWLAEIGEKINIEEVFIIGKKAAGDTYGKATLNAEATEALIGGIYEYSQDLESIHNWLTPYWIQESQSILEDPDYYNCKSALQEWCQARKKSVPIYQSEERNCQHGNSKRFFCEVFVDGKSVGLGWGRSRRESEQEAGREAIAKLKRKHVKLGR